MVIETFAAQVVRALFPAANHVAILGPFNNWSTTATPMTPMGNGLWEASLTQSVAPGAIQFFVWDRGHVGGRLAYGDGLDIDGAMPE